VLYVYTVVTSVVVVGDYVGYFVCDVCVVLCRQLCCDSDIVFFVCHCVCAYVIDIIGDVVVGAGDVKITVNGVVGTSCVVIVTFIVVGVCVYVVFTTVDVNVIIAVSDINVVIVVVVALDRLC